MGVEIGSFEHDLLRMHYIQSGILVLFSAPVVQRVLEAAQPEAQVSVVPGLCREWELPGAAQ